MDNDRMLKFSSYVYFPSTCINKMFPYLYAYVILCSVGEVNIFEHRCNITALKHIRGDSSISWMPGCGPNALPKNWI